jgi:hypothetical protein
VPPEQCGVLLAVRRYFASDKFLKWLLNFFAAVRAVVEFFADRVAAEFTQQPGFFLRGREFPTEFVLGPVAAFTQNERLAFFDPGHRDEKDLKIVIDAPAIGLVQTAYRTTPGILIYDLYFWGYADYKKHFKRLTRMPLVCK